MKFSTFITLSALFGAAVSVKMNKVHRLAKVRQGPNAGPPPPPAAAEDGSVPTTMGWNCTWPWEDLHATCVDAKGNVGQEDSCRDKADACYDGSDDWEESWWYVTGDKGGDDKRHCQGSGVWYWDNSHDGSYNCKGFGIYDIVADEDGDKWWDETCEFYDCDG